MTKITTIAHFMVLKLKRLKFLKLKSKIKSLFEIHFRHFPQILCETKYEKLTIF